MKCKKCGQEISKKDKYCTLCGQKVEKDVSSKLLYGTAVVLVCIAFVLGGVIFVQKNSSSSNGSNSEYISAEEYIEKEKELKEEIEKNPDNQQAYEDLYTLYNENEELYKENDNNQELETLLNEIEQRFPNGIPNVPTLEQACSVAENHWDEQSSTCVAQEEETISYAFDMTPIAYKDKGYIVRLDNKYGVIDTAGNWLIDAEYEALVFGIENKTNTLTYGLLKTIGNYDDTLSIDHFFDESKLENVVIIGANDMYNHIYLDASGQPYYSSLSSKGSSKLEETKEYDSDKWDSTRFKDFLFYAYDETEPKTPYIMLKDRTILKGYDKTEIMSIYRKTTELKNIGDYGLPKGLYGSPFNTPVKGLVYVHEGDQYRIYDVDTGKKDDTLYENAEVISDTQMKVVKGKTTYIVGSNFEVEYQSSTYEDISCPVGNKVFVKKDGKWILVDKE